MIFALIYFIKSIIKYIFRSSYREQMILQSRLYFKKRYKLIQNIKFSEYNIDLVDSKSFLSQYEEIFSKQGYKFHSDSKTPLIIDCGSNIGLSILYYKKIYPNAIIHAFEPDEKIFETLSHNINKNNLKNVLLNNCAVWINNGVLNFFNENSDGGHLINEVKDEERISKVNCISLSEYISNFNTIDFLKLDIEGAEYEVLVDCSKHLDKVKFIFLEFHSIGNNEKQLVELLQILINHGFSFKIETADQSFDPFNNIKLKPFNFQLNIFAINNNFITN